MADLIDRAPLQGIANCLAIAVAVSLPWSTSATSILIVIWLLALLPTLSWAELRRELTTPAGGLPALLVLLGFLGMLWADVSWLERWQGFESFTKLLTIPLLLVQFRRTERGYQVFAGYLLSCIALLAATIVVAAIPPLSAAVMHVDKVIVKNPATQSGEFVTCIAGLLFLGVAALEQRRWYRMGAVVAVVLGMLTNILFVATSRTALIVLPLLLIVFAARQLSRRGMAIMLAAIVLLTVVGWLSSPYLRARTDAIFGELQRYEAVDEPNSSGERIEFYTKSLRFIRSAPVIGHGTGSITALFAASAAGQTGAAASPSTNPHNQTFGVAIQIGLVGAAVLWAMWIAHLLIFRAPGLAEWVGLIIVVQNIIGSLFNSHLFDFVQGWVYVVGVGVAGGTALRRKAAS
jgi:O-antigen ligase